jgi:hypothetical protein
MSRRMTKSHVQRLGRYGVTSTKNPEHIHFSRTIIELAAPDLKASPTAGYGVSKHVESQTENLASNPLLGRRIYQDGEPEPRRRRMSGTVPPNPPVAPPILPAPIS